MAALSMCMFVDPDMLRGQTFTAPAVLAASVAARRAALRRGKTTVDCMPAVASDSSSGTKDSRGASIHVFG